MKSQDSDRFEGPAKLFINNENIVLSSILYPGQNPLGLIGTWLLKGLEGSTKGLGLGL